MKAVRYILGIIAIVVIAFLAVYGRLQSREAEANITRAIQAEQDAIALAELAREEAARVRVMEAEVIRLKTELEECRNENSD